jgi:hypothetical protein
MDLFRSLLLKAEEQPFKGQVNGQYVSFGSIPGYSREEVMYHAQLAQDAGFIEVTFLLSDDFFVHRLTYAGHEFLDAAREDRLWKKAKQTVLSNAGTLTVEALKTALSILMQQAARGMIA